MSELQRVFAVFCWIQIDDGRLDRCIFARIVVHNAVYQFQTYVLGIRHGRDGCSVHRRIIFEDTVFKLHAGRCCSIIHTSNQNSAAVWHISCTRCIGMGKGIAVDGYTGTRLDAYQVIKSLAQSRTVDVAIQFGTVFDRVAVCISRLWVDFMFRISTIQVEWEHGRLDAECT